MAHADPEARKAYIKAWRAANPDKVAAMTRRYQQTHAAELRESRRAPATAEASRRRAAQYIADLKSQLFDHYGRACLCCGEATIEFLTFDHPLNDGADRRREHGGAQQEWRAVRRAGFPPGYFEVRCYNCNCARARYGACPHERRLEAVG